MGVGCWFEDTVRRGVGCGRSTYFWTDNWVGEVLLWIKFPHLFDLASDRWVAVEEMVRRGLPLGSGGSDS